MKKNVQNFLIRYCCSILLLFFCNISAQKQNNIPTKGKMVFEEKLVIVDPQKIDAAVLLKKPILVNLFRDMLFELNDEENQAIDSATIKHHITSIIEPSVHLMIDPRLSIFSTLEHIYFFKDSIIEYSTRENYMNESNEVTIINRDSGKMDYYIIKDSIKIEKNFIRVSLKESETKTTLQEFRNDKKNILGFECFRVEVIQHENSNQSFELFGEVITKEFIEKYNSLLDSNTPQIFYVTEQISCKYHPATRLKTILDKYYPLEIVTPTLFTDGDEKRITLKEIELHD